MGAETRLVVAEGSDAGRGIVVDREMIVGRDPRAHVSFVLTLVPEAEAPRTESQVVGINPATYSSYAGRAEGEHAYCGDVPQDPGTAALLSVDLPVAKTYDTKTFSIAVGS